MTRNASEIDLGTVMRNTTNEVFGMVHGNRSITTGHVAL